MPVAPSIYWGFILIIVISPVTLVPMIRGKGISSGRSLQFDKSDSFLCCRRRIFCRFCLSAVLSSAKNAEEHLKQTWGNICFSLHIMFMRNLPKNKIECDKLKTKEKSSMKYFFDVAKEMFSNNIHSFWLCCCFHFT